MIECCTLNTAHFLVGARLLSSVSPSVGEAFWPVSISHLSDVGGMSLVPVGLPFGLVRPTASPHSLRNERLDLIDPALRLRVIVLFRTLPALALLDCRRFKGCSVIDIKWFIWATRFVFLF